MQRSWFLTPYQDIVSQYILPMQDKVFPSDHVLKGFREVVVDNKNYSTLRTLGTCSIRVKNTQAVALQPYGNYDVRIKKSIGPRLLLGEIV